MGNGGSMGNDPEIMKNSCFLFEKCFYNLFGSMDSFKEPSTKDGFNYLHPSGLG